jgi:hypothetical protein
MYLPHRRYRRRGLASLEYAMALPLLLFLLAAILSTAYLGLGRMYAGVGARQQAWKDRENQRTGQPLFFSPQDQALVVTKKKDVKVFFVTSKIPTQSRLAVLGGSWDYRDVDPGKDMTGTTGKMIASQGASFAGDLGSALGLLGDLTSLKGLAGSLLSAGSRANNQIAQQQQKLNQQMDKERQKNAQDLAKAQKDLAKAQAKKKADDARLANLQDDRKQAEKLTDATKRAAKLAEIDGQIAAARKDITADTAEINRLQIQVTALQKAHDAMN